MKYGATGVRTVLVTATRGERGKAGHPPVCAPHQLAACREGNCGKLPGLSASTNCTSRLPRPRAGGCAARRNPAGARVAHPACSTVGGRLIRSERLQRPPRSCRDQPLHDRRDRGCRRSTMASRCREPAHRPARGLDAADCSVGGGESGPSGGKTRRGLRARRCDHCFARRFAPASRIPTSPFTQILCGAERASELVISLAAAHPAVGLTRWNSSPPFAAMPSPGMTKKVWPCGAGIAW